MHGLQHQTDLNRRLNRCFQIIFNNNLRLLSRPIKTKHEFIDNPRKCSRTKIKQIYHIKIRRLLKIQQIKIIIRYLVQSINKTESNEITIIHKSIKNFLYE